MISSGTVAGLAALFAAAFGAATILPMQSEAVLAGMVAGEVAPVWLLFVTASVGNTLGSVVNYWLGVGIDQFEGRWWFPVSPERMARVKAWYRKWGVWSLLLSWAPFADPLTVAAGILRTPFWLFLVLVAIAKTGRYAVVIWLCEGVSWCSG